MLDRLVVLRMLFLIARIDFKQTATGAHMPCGRRFLPAMGSPVAILILNDRTYAILKCGFHSGTFPSFVCYFRSASENNIQIK